MKEIIVYILAGIGTVFSASVIAGTIQAMIESIIEKQRYRCKVCGKQCKINDNFCSNCGKPLE